MKSIALAAALLAVATVQTAPASGASRGRCYTPAALEAEQAIRFVTGVMIVSTTCRDTVYAQFRLRNRKAIIRYQNALIRHFHSRSAFDRWNTGLANEFSRRQAGVPSSQVCQQSAGLLKQASLLDAKGLHELAAAKAASAGSDYVRCGRR
jgi:hypothetical protein